MSAEIERDIVEEQEALSHTISMPPKGFWRFTEWKYGRARGASGTLGREPLQPAATPENFGAGRTPLGGWSGARSGHPGEEVGGARWSSPGTQAPGASTGMLAGLDIPNKTKAWRGENAAFFEC